MPGDQIIIKPEDKFDRPDPPAKPGNAPTFKLDGVSAEIHHVDKEPDGGYQEISGKVIEDTLKEIIQTQGNSLQN